MKTIFLILLIAMTACNSRSDNSPEASTPVGIKEKANSQTHYYFIRHAEKDTLEPSNRDPELTEEGIKRSAHWARVFEHISFDMVYSTDYKRTRATAQPIAESQDKDVRLYSSKELNDEQFQKDTKGKTVLVVGHSNTNHQFANSILKENLYEEFDESEYGALLMVSIDSLGIKDSRLIIINNF